MKHTLLQWNSKNHGLTVALQSIHHLVVHLDIKIEELLLLQNDTFDEVQVAELTIFKSIDRTLFKKYQKKYENKERKRVEEVYKLCCDLKESNAIPKLTQKRLHIKSVTDYQSIYNAVREYLKTFSNDVQLHINVSSGTPQMHTVWLMLNASGYLLPTTRIWSSQFNRNKDIYTLTEVKFKPKTYLNEIFETAYRKKHSIIINPNDTKSNIRQEAESNLRLFASIPNVPILLIGERGVGKTTRIEQFVRDEFYTDKPFRVLPCGIFSEELMRSELFGYEKGAFTGATIRKEGVFHQFKNGGLLFLDEIHDLSKPLQRQLMQVLQSKTFLPIGSNKEEKTDFRLITATNLSFEVLIKRLDLDFIDRIAQYIVEIPPLRESREDVFNEWQKTWENISNNSPLPKSRVLDNYLKTAPFYGNFRSLERLAHYLFAFTQTKSRSEAIDMAIKSMEKFQYHSILNDKSYFVSQKNYNTLVNYFNQDLAKWAVETYGSRKAASNVLEKSEAWLSNAINGKSRS